MPETTSGTAETGIQKKPCYLKIKVQQLMFPVIRTFEPIIVPKHEKRLSILNDQIISIFLGGVVGGLPTAEGGSGKAVGFGAWRRLPPILYVYPLMGYDKALLM
jgi:hypothetical protein